MSSSCSRSRTPKWRFVCPAFCRWFAVSYFCRRPAGRGVILTHDDVAKKERGNCQRRDTQIYLIQDNIDKVSRLFLTKLHFTLYLIRCISGTQCSHQHMFLFILLLLLLFALFCVVLALGFAFLRNQLKNSSLARWPSSNKNNSCGIALTTTRRTRTWFLVRFKTPASYRRATW